MTSHTTSDTTGAYTNPIIPGDWSDPGVVRVGEDYYSVRSTFGWQPGLLIAHSRDLVHWRYIGAADTDNAFDLPPGITDRGIWGSDIGYIPDRKTFVVYAPARGMIRVFHATRPQGPYTDGGEVVRGYDPGFFADDDGQLYLTKSGGEVYRLTPDGTRVVGDPIAEVAGGEGPEIFRRGEFYYYLISPGGTRPYQDHQITSYRARDLAGPWEPDPANPLMHAPHDTGAALQGPGHGEVFQTHRGEWFLTYHAYELSHYSLGRQMCLEPVDFTDDGWWRPRHGRIPSERSALPALTPAPCAPQASDDFDTDALGPQWFFHGPTDRTGKCWNLTDRPGCLRIVGQPGDVRAAATSGQAFLQRVTDKAFEFTTRITFDARRDGEAAGLLLYHDPDRHAWLTTTVADGRRVFEVAKHDKPYPVGRDPADVPIDRIVQTLADTPTRRTVLARADNTLGDTVHLKVSIDGCERATFAVSGDGRAWSAIDAEVHFGDSWHHRRLGRPAGSPDLGWVGCGRANVWTGATMGVFACAGDGGRSPHADFHHFHVTPRPLPASA